MFRRIWVKRWEKGENFKNFKSENLMNKVVSFFFFFFNSSTSIDNNKFRNESVLWKLPFTEIYLISYLILKK